MKKFERRIENLERLIDEWYYTGDEMIHEEYFELTTKIERIFKYMGQELKHSEIAKSYYDKLLTLSYVYGTSEIPLPEQYQINY